jgi:hypothetical protein
MAKEEKITLYLAPWQKRMMKDFMDKASLRARPLGRITKVELTIKEFYCPASYKVPPYGMVRGDWILYLTDEQMNIVRERAGLRSSITSLNISKEAIDGGAIVFK